MTKDLAKLYGAKRMSITRPRNSIESAQEHRFDKLREADPARCLHNTNYSALEMKLAAQYAEELERIVPRKKLDQEIDLNEHLDGEALMSVKLALRRAINYSESLSLDSPNDRNTLFNRLLDTLGLTV